MGLSTAFLTGFVSAANKSMYETRMAAHEESVEARKDFQWRQRKNCLLYTSPSPRDRTRSRMPSSA